MKTWSPRLPKPFLSGALISAVEKALAAGPLPKLRARCRNPWPSRVRQCRHPSHRPLRRRTVPLLPLANGDGHNATGITGTILTTVSPTSEPAKARECRQLAADSVNSCRDDARHPEWGDPSAERAERDAFFQGRRSAVHAIFRDGDGYIGTGRSDRRGQDGRSRRAQGRAARSRISSGHDLPRRQRHDRHNAADPDPSNPAAARSQQFLRDRSNDFQSAKPIRPWCSLRPRRRRCASS